MVSKDKGEALVTYVQVLSQPNYRSRKICLKGLDPDRDYRLEIEDTQEFKERAKAEEFDGICRLTQPDGQVYSGRLLMQGGFLIQRLHEDFSSVLLHFIGQ